MKYNPEIHHRKSIRLKEFDYSKQGMYFITICTQDRKNLFWDVNKNNEKRRGGACSAQTLQLNYIGKIIEQKWIELENRYTNIQLGNYVIMPNHLHGIIELNKYKRAERAPPLQLVI